jgi:hypothetical protein
MRKCNYKFGRKRRTFNSRIPHYSALLNIRRGALLPVPDQVDYTKGMPVDFGMMANDRLGICTCAAYYHARQVWTFNAQGVEITEPDRDVIKLYEEACHYNPLLFWTDAGGVEQDVLQYLLDKGAPIGDGSTRVKILAFAEVDFRNIDDVKRTIFECGVAYIGFAVPSNLDPESSVWDYDPSATLTNEGHAVVLVGFEAGMFKLISWGRLYQMTEAFFSQYVDECYAIADPAFIESAGLTPAGLTLQELEEQMQAMRMANLEELARELRRQSR